MLGSQVPQLLEDHVAEINMARWREDTVKYLSKKCTDN